MTRSLELRLVRLERRAHEHPPGESDVLTWYSSLTWQHPVLGWVLETERGRPELTQAELVVPVGRHGLRPNPRLRPWESARQRQWCERFWSKRRGEPEEGDYRQWYQDPEDPDVPKETESARLFGYVAASVPPMALKWAHALVDKPQRATARLPSEWDLKVFRWALDLLHIEKTVRRSWGMHGYVPLADIPLPRWAKNAKLHGHGSEREED
jgi:hypothetical protein